MKSSEEVDILLLYESSFAGMSKKQREALNIYYEEMSTNAVLERCSSYTRNGVNKLVSSDIGKKYLKWRASQEEYNGKTKRDKLVKELEKIAFSNMDDFIEFKSYKKHDGEEITYLDFDINAIKSKSKRERRDILAAVDSMSTEVGKSKKFKIKSNKFAAIIKLLEISGIEQDELDREGRSGDKFIDAIKKLRGFSDGQENKEKE